MPKKPDDTALAAALVRAKENEGRFIDTAVALYRDALEKNMARARAHAMVAGQFTASINAATKFSFQPGRETVSVEMCGSVSAEFSERSQSSLQLPSGRPRRE